MLTAIAECVGRYGLVASTQDVMARESGFSRPLLRHYLGNREEIVNALWDFLMRPYQRKPANRGPRRRGHPRLSTPGRRHLFLSHGHRSPCGSGVAN